MMVFLMMSLCAAISAFLILYPSLSIFFFCFFGLVLVLVWFGSLPFPYLLVFMMVFFLSRSGSILSIRHIYTRAHYT